jgi:streptogramin lyase
MAGMSATVRLLVLVTALALVGCSGAASQSATPSPPPTITAAQPTPTTEPSPTTVAPTTAASPSSSGFPEPPALTAPVLTEWHQQPTIDAPGAGSITFADGHVFAVNRMDAGFTGNVPNGEIYRIDPATGERVDTIEHARGGFPAVGLGAIWYVNAEFGQTVTRLDLETLEVERFQTSTTEDPVPEAVLVAGGWVWVGNNHDGTVAKVNPQTLKVEKTIVLTDPGGFGVRGKAATDGTSLWFGISRTGEIVRIDAATAEEVSRMRLPQVPHEQLPAGLSQSDSSVPEQMVIAGDLLYALTVNHIYAIDVATVGSEHIVADIPTGLWPPFLTIDADGDVWSVMDGPDGLFRIDSETSTVLGRVPLDLPADSSIDIVGGDGSLWVRVIDGVIELKSDS